MERVPRPHDPETQREESLSEKPMTRRGFLAGVTAAVGVAAGGSPATALESSPRPVPRPETLHANTSIEDLKDAVYAHYRPMREQVLEFTHILEQDVDLVLDRSYALTKDVPAYENFFQVLHAELPLDDISEPTQSAIRDVMLCVPFVESRHDDAATSAVGAFGVMQLMPATWEEHAGPQDDPDDILAHVRVAGALLSQTYRFLVQRHQEIFQSIAVLLYDGNEDRCQREFVALLVVAAYFSGMGTVSRVLDQFAHDYITDEDIQRMAAVGVTTDTYGTYSLLTTASQYHTYDANFGPEAAAYVSKALAARAVLEHSLPPALREEFLVAALDASPRRDTH